MVPSITDNGVSIIESCSILRYLATTRNVDDHWYPKDPLLQSKVDSYLAWQHFNTRYNCALYFQVSWLIPTMTQKPINTKSKKSSYPEWKIHLKKLNKFGWTVGRENILLVHMAKELFQLLISWHVVNLNNPLLHLDRIFEDFLNS